MVNPNRKQGRRSKYMKTMRGYWMAEPSGTMKWTRSGKQHAYVRVDADSVPDNAVIAIMGLAEDHGDDHDWVDKHWLEFHKHIANSYDKQGAYYVRLVHNGPLVADLVTRKADADAKYGAEDDRREKKDKRTRIINLTQYLKPDYWSWNSREFKAVKSGSAKGVGMVILKRLEAAGLEVKDAYIIKHDADARELWDVDSEAYVRQPKDDHVHFLARVSGRGKLLEEFAEIIGVSAEFLLYPSRGKYAWDNPLSYLIHIKDEDKHLYDPHDVVTLAGADYLGIYATQKKGWEKARAIKAKKSIRDHDLDWFLDEIRQKHLSRQTIRLNDEYEAIYSRNKEACDKALAYVNEVKIVDSHMAFERGDYTMTCVFVTGKPGLGKTAFVNALIDYLCDVYPGWTATAGANANAAEAWNGEDILLLDDALSSSLGGPTIWKHFLDPHNAQAISVRYTLKGNGLRPKPRVMLISSEFSPEQFFAPMCSKGGLDIGQYLRRIGVVLKVLDFAVYDSYNFRIATPQRCAPHRVEAIRMEERTSIIPADEFTGRVEERVKEQIQVRYCFERVTYELTAADYRIDDEDPLLTPWYAAEQVVRGIDAHQHVGSIASRPNADEIFGAVWDYLADAYRKTDVPVPTDYKILPGVIPESKRLSSSSDTDGYASLPPLGLDFNEHLDMDYAECKREFGEGIDDTVCHSLYTLATQLMSENSRQHVRDAQDSKLDYIRDIFAAHRSFQCVVSRCLAATAALHAEACLDPARQDEARILVDLMYELQCGFGDYCGAAIWVSLGFNIPSPEDGSGLNVRLIGV